MQKGVHADLADLKRDKKKDKNCLMQKGVHADLADLKRD